MKQGTIISRTALICALGTTSLLLASCGGGGSAPTPTSSPTPPPVVANDAPTFSSAGGASVTENATGSIYTATGSDPDGDTLTFSISGGPDADEFTLSGAELSFNQTPDFERPRDSDRNNTYDIELQVTDGRGGSATLDLSVSVFNDKEGISVTRIAAGFDDPVSLGFLQFRGVTGLEPQGRIALAQRNGEIFEVDGTTGQRTLMVDVFDGQPRGELLDIGFNNKGRVNFYSGLYGVVREPNGRVFIQRYSRSSIDEVELLPAGSEPVSAKLFDGVDFSNSTDFFVALSDEDGLFAQDLMSLRGKLISLEGTDPFSGASPRPGSFNTLIIGTGIRRSGGAGIIDNQILLSDQGVQIEHELNFFDQNARPLDFGWPGREGTQGRGNNPPAAVVGPTIAYGFGTMPDQGTGAVFGGLFTGPGTELDNAYVFGDTSGAIWSVPFDELTSGFLLRPEQMDRRRADFEPDSAFIDSPVAFIVDDMGRLFILDSDGDLFRVDAS